MFKQTDIYLASSSPRRKEILLNIGLMPHIISVNIDETPNSNENVEDYVLRMAIEKNLYAQTILTLNNQIPKFPIISADTCVVIDNLILGKPKNQQDAYNILKKLSAKTHQVFSSVCVFYQQKTQSILQKNTVEFKALTDQEINNYIASNEPMDKAGAYAIQGYGAIFIKQHTGSFSGVMGLPVFETISLLNSYLYD